MDILEQLREFMAPLFRSFWFYFGIALLISWFCKQMDFNLANYKEQQEHERIAKEISKD